MDYEELKKDVLWTIQHYGSDAMERKSPGSKVRSQADRIVEFVRQWEEVNSLLRDHNFDLISIKGVS